MQDFIKAINGTPEEPPIIAYFKNGSSGEYTRAILELLKTDPATLEIIDGTTGEIIYTA